MARSTLLASYNGIEEYIHENTEKPGDLVVETFQDCQAIVDGVKIERDAPIGKEWRKVACIPLIFFDKAAKEGWLHDKAKWWAFLNDPDNAAFRVWNGRIGPSRQV